MNGWWAVLLAWEKPFLAHPCLDSASEGGIFPELLWVALWATGLGSAPFVSSWLYRGKAREEEEEGGWW